MIGTNRRWGKKVSMALLLCVGPAVVAAAEPAPRKRESRYEVKFMQNMIDHHMMAVMMGELCVERAVHEELAELCHQIITTQNEEIELMQDWLDDWYGISYEPRMSKKAEREMDELAELDGADFEIAFMQMMIEHHAVAVEEGGKCAQRAYHAQLEDLCHNIVETQSAEIELMQGWLCDWYDICQDE